MFFKPCVTWSAAQDWSSVAWRNYIAPALTSISAYYLQLCMRISYLLKYYITRPTQTPVRFRNDFSSCSLLPYKTLIRFQLFFSYQSSKISKNTCSKSKDCTWGYLALQHGAEKHQCVCFEIKMPSRSQVRYLTQQTKILPRYFTSAAALGFFANSAALVLRII